MNLSIDNLKKHDNKKLKKVADYLLYTLPLYLGAILALPLPERLKLYINFGVTILIVTAKGLTKFSTDEEEFAKDKDGEQKLDDIKNQI
jgi:hypothetical protein